MYRSAESRPQIRLHEGREGIREMYEELLTQRHLSSYDIICSEETWLKMDPAFFEQFKKRRAQKKIKTRLILDHSPPSLLRKEAEEQTLSEVKIIPPGLHWKTTAGCYIFKDRVIFLAYKKEHVAVEIFSQEIVEFMQANFEFMWRFLAR